MQKSVHVKRGLVQMIHQLMVQEEPWSTAGHVYFGTRLGMLLERTFDAEDRSSSMVAITEVRQPGCARADLA